MKINRAYRFRIYPNSAQRQQLARQFGACRWVYNYFLRVRIDYYAEHKDDQKKGLTYADTSAILTQMKKREETAWLKDAGAQALQQSLRDLDKAYNNFFNKQARFPRFKAKRSRQSFRVPQGFGVSESHLHIPKMSPIRMVMHRPVEGVVKNVTVVKTPTDKYFAVLCCEVDIPEPQYDGGAIGVDLGLKDFAVTSDGEHIEAPKYLRKAEKRLRRTQRHLSRCKRGSRGREKARRVVARQYERVANQRSDFIHKLSRRLVNENQVIGLEDLAVKNMLGNHSLAKSISDAGWAEFVRCLEYKGAWYGCEIWRVDRFFPSSKRCHDCGFVLDTLPLHVRSWTCPECGAIHDRDENAARNILEFCTAGSAGTHTPGERGNGRSWNPEAEEWCQQITCPSPCGGASRPPASDAEQP